MKVCLSYYLIGANVNSSSHPLLPQIMLMQIELTSKLHTSTGQDFVQNKNHWMEQLCKLRGVSHFLALEVFLNGHELAVREKDVVQESSDIQHKHVSTLNHARLELKEKAEGMVSSSHLIDRLYQLSITVNQIPTNSVS